MITHSTHEKVTIAIARRARLSMPVFCLRLIVTNYHLISYNIIMNSENNILQVSRLRIFVGILINLTPDISKTMKKVLELIQII